MSSHSENIDTVVVIHCSERWESANYRYAYDALADALPPHAAVICVDRPIDCVVAPIKRTKLFLRGIFRTRVHQPHARLTVVRPWLVLHEMLAPKVPGSSAINRRHMHRQLRKVLDRFYPNVTRVINWIYYPHQRWVWDVFPNSGRVYHCYDEYTSSPTGVDRPERRLRETEVLKSADLTLVTAEALAGPRRHLTKRLAFFPNGVPDFFLQDAPPQPDPIDDIPAPRICYLGQTYDFILYRDLHEVFARHPDWHLVFIGPVRDLDGTRELDRLANVHFVGKRPHEQLPRILPKCEVALLPFAVNRYTSGSKFLKIYAYMAAGLPVVSTNLPGLSESEMELFIIAEDEPNGLDVAIEKALSADRAKTARQMRDAAMSYTWSTICRDQVVPVLRETFGF